MSVEAFAVGYDRANYHASIPQGKDSESVFNAREERIKENILKYLGEYRLGVKFSEIFYRLETDLTTGETYLASDVEGPIRNTFRKAINTRKEKGLSVKREVAECMGFEKLERQLIDSSENSLFVWVSPPGPKSDGFGDYSFTFVGQKIKDAKTNENLVRLIPYRNIFSLSEHQAYLLGFDSSAKHFNSDIDFLANPIVLFPKESVQIPEDILRLIGEQEKFSVAWISQLKKEISPLVERYIDLVKTAAEDEELTKVKYAIENYVIAVESRLGSKMTIINEGLVGREDFEKTIEIYGSRTPPRAGGSCGSSASSTLSEFQEEFNKKWEYHNGDCIVCGVKDIDVGPCSICKECEKKFDKEASF